MPVGMPINKPAPTETPKAAAPAQPKKSMHRSPAFPFISLKRALERIKTLHDKEGKHAVRFDVAVGHWGYKVKSSGALQTVGALRQYGLINVADGTGEDRMLSLSPRSITILLDSREGAKEKALAEAALAPKLYANLFRKWGKDLPSDANMTSHLTVDLDFNPASVDSVVAAYKETLAYVTDLDSGTLSDIDSDKPESTETEDEDMNASGQNGDVTTPRVSQGQDRKPQIQGEEEHFRVKLAGGRMVRVLFQGAPPTQAEIQKLITLLEFNKDQYPAEEKTPAEA